MMRKLGTALAVVIFLAVWAFSAAVFHLAAIKYLFGWP